MKLTERQQEILDAVNDHTSMRQAADAMGVNESTVRKTIKAIKTKAATEGVDPGYFIKGKSTLYGPNGEVKVEWVKTDKEKEDIKLALEAAVEAFSESVPKAEPIATKGMHDEHLLNLHVLTDYHLGMYSWPEETGSEWNLDLAEDVLVKWFADAIRRAPKAEIGVLAQLGDMLHYDSMVPVTPTGNHIQDTDSRYSLVVRTAIRVIRRVIRVMLKKYKTVHVIMAEGNHDMSSSVWLRELLASHYEKEPRLTVDQTVDPYYVLEHGDTSLFFHHGHKRRPASVDTVFVGKNREIYGRTKFSYGHLGHMHHIDTKETNLMIVEQHRTMAAKDAYATRGGWLAGRSAVCITYHKRYGEVGRVTTTYEMIDENT